MPHNSHDIRQQKGEGITLKGIFSKIEEWIRYFLGKWVVLLVAGVVGGALGLGHALTKTTQYTASVSFIIEEQGGGGAGLSAAAGIAAQLGFNIGGLASSGGFFQGDNIIEFLKSRSMIDQTLLTEVEIDGEEMLLVDRYIAYNELRDKWSKKEHLAGIQFKDTTGIYLQDSLMRVFHNDILKKNLVIGKLDRKLNIIEVMMTTPDEPFSKAFVETLIHNASDFYIRTRTQKAEENLAVLTHQVDSVRRELDAAIRGVAAATDANPNPNRALQSLRVGAQQRTVDVQANTAILSELVKNQELAKITLRNEKPILQTLDKPILPLENDKLGKAKGIVIGGLLAGFITMAFLLLRRIYRQVMADDSDERGEPGEASA